LDTPSYDKAGVSQRLQAEEPVQRRPELESTCNAKKEMRRKRIKQG
jgi:hypothetical protein